MEALTIEEELYQAKVVENTGGKSYLLAIKMETQNIVAHLYCTGGDGMAVEDITPADWLEEDPEWHFLNFRRIWLSWTTEVSLQTLLTA